MEGSAAAVKSAELDAPDVPTAACVELGKLRRGEGAVIGEVGSAAVGLSSSRSVVPAGFRAGGSKVVAGQEAVGSMTADLGHVDSKTAGSAAGDSAAAGPGAVLGAGPGADSDADSDAGSGVV